MLFKHLIELYDILDDSKASGNAVVNYLKTIDESVNAETFPLLGEYGQTDMIRIRIPGKSGKTNGGTAPTIGLLGRLGGLGARPEVTGFVSDGDGALVATAIAAELLGMKQKGDCLEGDVYIATHICPDAPTTPHVPVPFMGSPVKISQVNQAEVCDELDAIMSVDTTKGNRIYNERGFAISPTVKEGYILKVSDDMLDIMQTTTGKLPGVFALTTQDITPYGNDLYHLNSILQPCTATDVPVVGVAVTTQTVVAGCATGATHIVDLEQAGRFMVEVAKAFGQGKCNFYDKEEYAHIQHLYGSMKRLQTLGN